jgi:TonB-dependent starch-binding outer membrane protein SusC
MKNRLLLMVGMVLFTLSIAIAQRNISGIVKNDAGEPLIGTSVVLKGTTQGVITDIDGKYSVSVPESATTLVFSFTGYGTQEIAIGASNVIDVRLTEGVGLDEVVVVGYGTQQKRNITGNVGSVKGEEIASLPVQSFDQALQGRVAGVNVNIPNGVLNNQPVFRIRGISSINLSSTPLIVIDGVPTFSGDLGNSAANNPLANLNPNDIESIEILKDASAAAIYGSRASAGVVLVTTKRGKKGKTKVSYDGWASWTSPARLPELLNAPQYVEVKNEAARNANLPQQYFLDTLNGQTVDTRWYDYAYRTGFSHNHGLNFSGGNESTNYFVSLGYTMQEGMILRNDFDRKSARLNIDHKVGKRFKLGGSFGYSNTFNSAPNTGSLPGQAFNTSGLGRLPMISAPIVPARLADGSYNIASNNQLGRGKNLNQVGFTNPLPIIDNNNFTSEGAQVQANVSAQIDILKGLYFRTQYGIDNVFVENISFQSPVHGDGFPGGLANNSTIKNNRWNWQNVLNYDLSVAEKHNFNLLVGNEQQRTLRAGWGIQRTIIADPFFTNVQGSFTTNVPAGNFTGENYLLSYFGRLNYDWDKKILLTVNARQDEFSAFAPGQKKGIFWGASGGITPSEFGFWKNLPFANALNYFRLRGSYGVVGNNNGIGDYAWYSLYNSGLYGPDPTIFFNQAGNDLLSWETSKKTDVGVNFGLFDDRITGEVSYFRNLIDGLILPVPQSPSKGIPGNSISTNVGSMLNSGWEFSLSGTVLKKTNFKWSSNFNIALMENEVKSLDATNSDIFGITAGLEQTNIIRVGQSVGSLYVVETAGVNPATGRRVFINGKGEQIQYSHVVPTGQSRWTKLDGTTASAVNLNSDGKIFGPTLPKWFGSWDNTFSAYGFDLNIQLQYSGGNYIYNGSKAGLRDMRFWNNHTDVLSRWKKEGDVSDVPRVVFGDNISNGSAIQISENVEKGDFLRVRNLTFGYNLPKDLLAKANMSNARVFVTANNAFLFTNYTGTDPEVSTNGNINVSPGVDRNSVPMARTILVGVNVGF